MNKIFIVGRLVSDPQPFVTQSGRLVSNVTIACNDNTNKNETYFFPCVAWQTPAKFINTYLKKGDSVVIDGKLIRRSYVSKDGKNVFVTEIIIDLIKLVSSPRRNQDSPYIENSQYNSFSNQKQNAEVFFENNSTNNQNSYNENNYSDVAFPKTNKPYENNFLNNNVSNDSNMENNKPIENNFTNNLNSDFNSNIDKTTENKFSINASNDLNANINKMTDNNFSNSSTVNSFNANTNSMPSQNNDSSVIYNNNIANEEQYDEVIDLDWLDEIDN
ncbi:MAG: single-stranded DNA-binding protein [Mycoplasmoidaceae bacterium]